MLSLAAANWDHLRELSAHCSPTDPLLAGLWNAALSEKAQILRISAHRTVVRVQLCGESGADAQMPDGTDGTQPETDWLLKICHPRRSWEWLRRRFSTPPALREIENWRLLAHRLQIQAPMMAEQLAPNLGLFARPFWTGKKVPAALRESPEAMKALGQGVARLHHQKWSDPDLDANDLLFADAFDGQLIPLDLGHAKVGMLSLSAESVHLDLERLIASLPPKLAPALAKVLLHFHSDDAWLKNWSMQKLLNRARTLRLRRTWKHSARCLRTVSDFVRDEAGARRRDFESELPSDLNGEVKKTGPRSTTLKMADAAWKFYPRQGTGQHLRRSLLFGPGVQAYRKMYALELLGVSVAAVQAWAPAPGGEWLATQWLDGDPPQSQHLPEIAEYIAKLHAFGIGHRDAKPSNFIRGDHLTLIDADGIQMELRNPWRDLARVIAECPPQSEMETSCFQAYSTAWCKSLKLKASPWDVPAMAKKCVVHAQHFRGLLKANEVDPKI